MNVMHVPTIKKPAPPTFKYFQMCTDDEFMSGINEWRRQEPDLPSRAESIRRLVRIALKASKRKGKAD